MNRDSFITQSVRKKWLGHGGCAIHVSNLRIGRYAAISRAQKSLRDIGIQMGADIDLTEITPIVDEARPYHLIFHATYYTMK